MIFGIAIAVILICGIIWFVRSPYLTRLLFTVSDRQRDRGLTTPDDITRIDDQSYGTDPMQVLDVYFPKGTTEPLPTILNLHGGGYTYGSKEVYQYYCMSLAQHGFTVVSYSYRLAPKWKFPAQIEDTNAALRFALDHAEQYHIDPNNIFFIGDSAGAHLNAQYTTAVTNPDYAALLNLKIPTFKLRGTVLNCGIYEAEASMNGMNYFAAAQDREMLDFLPYITEDFAPAFVMSATGDMCLPYAEPMHQLLEQRGVSSELHIYGNETEKPPHVFHCNIRTEIAARCNDEECAFFTQLIAH